MKHYLRQKLILQSEEDLSGSEKTREEPALAALPGGLLVLVAEVSEELGGLLLVSPHQLLQLLKLTSLLFLVHFGLLQALQGECWDICHHTGRAQNKDTQQLVTVFY